MLHGIERYLFLAKSSGSGGHSTGSVEHRKQDGIPGSVETSLVESAMQNAARDGGGESSATRREGLADAGLMEGEEGVGTIHAEDSSSTKVATRAEVATRRDGELAPTAEEEPGGGEGRGEDGVRGVGDEGIGEGGEDGASSTGGGEAPHGGVGASMEGNEPSTNREGPSNGGETKEPSMDGGKPSSRWETPRNAYYSWGNTHSAYKSTHAKRGADADAFGAAIALEVEALDGDISGHLSRLSSGGTSAEGEGPASVLDGVKKDGELEEPASGLSSGDRSGLGSGYWGGGGVLVICGHASSGKTRVLAKAVAQVLLNAPQCSS